MGGAPQDALFVLGGGWKGSGGKICPSLPLEELFPVGGGRGCTEAPRGGREKGAIGTGAAKHGSVIESLFNSKNQVATEKLLEVALARHEALASNIANVETPGYKRLDLAKNFSTHLQTELQRGDRKGLAALRPVISADEKRSSVMRTDGNNVQLDQELLAMASNTANIEVLTQFVSGSIKQLRTAITGRNA